MDKLALTGEVLDGRYRVIEPVAEGAMGVVYRAERVKLGRIVAVKVLHESLPNELSSRKRFEIEAMAMAKLEHPHCAAVVDVGLHEDRPFVVMDFVSGRNLKDVIAAEAPLPIPRAAELLRQILSGLAHAHEHGIIHRDIKPANLVLSQKAGLGDHVKILDFGLARLGQDSSLTTGLVVGTPSYMAPEQIRGTPIDGRVDVYACGVVLFELLTGAKPFVSAKDDPIEVCTMHLKLAPPRLADKQPGVDFGELEEVVARALAKAANDRYASAVEFAAALDAVVPRRVAPATPVAGVPVLEQRTTTEYAGVAAVPARAATPVAGVRTLPLPTAAIEAAVESASTVAAPAPPRAASPVLFPPPAPPAPAPAAHATPAAPVLAPPGPALRPSSPPHRPLSAPAPDPSAVMSATSLIVDESAAAPAPPGRAPTAAPPAPRAPGAPIARPPAPAGASSRRRRLLVGGGIAAAIGALVLAVAAFSGGAPAPVAPDAAPAPAPPPPPAPPDPAEAAVARATELLANGQKAPALELVLAARKEFPRDARLAFLGGRLYFDKLFWTEGMKHFRDAIRLDPGYRTDAELIKTVLRGFITTPRADAALAAFLREEVGDAARPYLEETAAQHPNPNVRARATAELRRYR